MSTGKKFGLSVLVLLSISSNVQAQHTYTDNQLVQYGKSIDVRKVDASLSSARLDKWLRSTLSPDAVVWRASPTCELKAPVENDYPICVIFTFRKKQIEGVGIIKVGTRLEGIGGEPWLEHLDVMSGLHPAPRSITELSELPVLVREMYAANAISTQPERDIDRLANAYREAQTEHERRSVCLDAIDAAVIARGQSVTVVDAIFGTDYAKKLPPVRKLETGVVEFHPSPHPGNDAIQRAYVGWYFAFEFDSDGTLQYYFVTNAHQK